jgi:hypothetical protein
MGPGWLEFLESCKARAGIDKLPNNLTRMLYLASLRDCNSGRYLHPELSPRIGIEGAHQALEACHERVFNQLLRTPVSEYLEQIQEYIRYTRTEESVVLATWQSIEAYRATVPVSANAIYREVFFLNVEIALVILNAKTGSSGNQPSTSRSRLELI